MGSVLLLVFFLTIALLCRSHPILQSVFVLFCVLGNGTISTDAEAVEIIDGLLVAYNSDVLYMFELDKPDARSVYQNNEIQKLIVQVRREPMPAQN